MLHLKAQLLLLLHLLLLLEFLVGVVLLLPGNLQLLHLLLEMIVLVVLALGLLGNLQLLHFLLEMVVLVLGLLGNLQLLHLLLEMVLVVLLLGLLVWHSLRRWAGRRTKKASCLQGWLKLVAPRLVRSWKKKGKLAPWLVKAGGSQVG